MRLLAAHQHRAVRFPEPVELGELRPVERREIHSLDTTPKASFSLLTCIGFGLVFSMAGMLDTAPRCV
jgi:hypothetical protein